ncbi:hypothetical protein N7528_004273 [Penicillium herquei]|nr:hypothetical protein N7528_004273 [Penicillium herquei]
MDVSSYPWMGYTKRTTVMHFEETNSSIQFVFPGSLSFLLLQSIYLVLGAYELPSGPGQLALGVGC